MARTSGLAVASMVRTGAQPRPHVLHQFGAVDPVVRGGAGVGAEAAVAAILTAGAPRAPPVGRAQPGEQVTLWAVAAHSPATPLASLILA